jgi:peptide/nickel transport system permease protein
MIESTPARGVRGIGGLMRRPRVMGRHSLTVGIAMLTTIVILCLVIPVVWPDSPNALVAPPFQSPSMRHPFGTDSVGRDVFVRVFAGGRLDLVVATGVIGVSLVLGTVLGTLSGATTTRGVDAFLMRVVDALIAFPFVILILVLVVLIGPARTIGPMPAGLPATVIAFLLVGWAYYARLARAQTLALRGSDHVVAARILGYSQPRVIARHLAPGVARVTAAYAVGDAILAVVVIASLAFLGAGVQPPTPEWGNIMYEGRAFVATAWWITVAPGVMLAITGVALSLVADALLAGDSPGR